MRAGSGRSITSLLGLDGLVSKVTGQAVSDWRVGSMQLANDEGSKAETVQEKPHETSVEEIVAYEKFGLKIIFLCQKEADGVCKITAKFCNSLKIPLTNFVFEASVQKGVQLNMQPQTEVTLPPHSDSVEQVMSIVNPPSMEKRLVMRIRVNYVCNGQTIQQLAQVDNFPQGY